VATRGSRFRGEKDNFVPRPHGETYAKLIPKCSELKIIPGAGHSAQVENPEDVEGQPICHLNWSAKMSPLRIAIDRV
jgi:hypothetical protein